MEIGTRGSPLAMWQAEQIAALLRARFPAMQFTIKPIRTRGDAIQSVALSKIGTCGVFVKEIQDHLLAGEIDVGVHSLKDLPSEDRPGTVLAPVSNRAADAKRAFVRAVGSGCYMPIGAYAVTYQGAIQLMGVLANVTDDRVPRDAGGGDPQNPAALGHAASAWLLANGGAEILAVDEFGGGR